MPQGWERWSFQCCGFPVLSMFRAFWVIVFVVEFKGILHGQLIRHVILNKRIPYQPGFINPPVVISHDVLV